MSSTPPTPPPSGEWPPPGGWSAPGGAGAPGAGVPPAGGYPPGGYPPGGYPPTGYPPGYPAGYGYGYGGQVPVDHPQGTTVLVLGILGLVACQVLAPFAWVMGNRALKEIDANPAAYANRGNVAVGRVLGIIGSVLILLGLLFFVLVMIIAVLGTSSSSSTVGLGPVGAVAGLI